jgi:hypothetical protein
MATTTAPGPCARPAHLAPRWRDLPRLADVLAQAYAPGRVPRGLLRRAFAPVWLLQVALEHIAGTLVAVGPAVLTVQQPRPLRRRLLDVLLLVPAIVLGLVAVLVPAVGVGAAAGYLLAGPLGCLIGLAAGYVAVMVGLAWQFASLIRGARLSVRLRRELAPLRQRRIWVELGGLAGGRDGHATRTLVRETLAWADAQGIGLGAVAVSASMQRVYGRAGFEPTRPGSPLLLRRPVSTTS